MPDTVFYTIGKVSTLCNVPIKTLRYYDQVGLLVPKLRKDENRYRYYTQEQILTLSMIRKLRALGVPLKDIKDIVETKDAGAMGNAIRERLEVINDDIDELRRQYESGEILLERLKRSRQLYEAGQTGYRTEQIRVEDIPLSNVLYTRRVKTNYRNADVSIDRWMEMFHMVQKQHLVMTGSVILTYHNEPLQQFYKNECDLEISVQVNELRLSDPRFKTFGGFPAVTAIHVGRNDEIIQTHLAAIKWLEREGYSIAGPISEEYILSPLDINNEDEQITKIIIPVTK
ncbi:MAG: MerR family transcriptional regulator [Firmicutes bacterium]|nr:MerR family transcriptional regulator [Bacillota bacterium]